MARFARTLADTSSRVLASHTVQVTTEAKASPIKTAFTTTSAPTNMPHGLKSRGNSPMVGGTATVGAAAGSAGGMPGSAAGPASCASTNVGQNGANHKTNRSQLAQTIT